MRMDRGCSKERRPIALFVSFSGHGGVERMMLNLANALSRIYGPVDLVTVKTRSSFLSCLEDGVRHVPLRASHTFQSLPELVDYLKARRPAALLAAKDRANQTAVLARTIARVPTRVVLRMGTTTSAALEGTSTLRRAAWFYPMRLLYPRADAVIAVSTGVAEDLAEAAGVPEHKLHTVPNPVVTDTIHRQAAAPLTHPWFGTTRPPVIVGMGRLTRQKDFPTLLRAFRIVNSQRPSRLVILGEGRDRASLESLASQLGIRRSVDFAGFTPNPYPYLKRASVFVLSSIWEGSPNALTEALALGTPVVATDCPSGPREILRGGAVAPLVPMRDPDAMAQAILDMLDHPPDKERLRRAAAPYTVENSARRYLEVLLGKPL